jgi:hypothetical protein
MLLSQVASRRTICPGAIEIDGNDAALYRASVIRPLEAAALITTDDMHEL